jgi:hypothetical protein
MRGPYHPPSKGDSGVRAAPAFGETLGEMGPGATLGLLGDE